MVEIKKFECVFLPITSLRGGPLAGS